MIDRIHELPLVRQCQILELSPSTAYYQPVPLSPEELALYAPDRRVASEPALRRSKNARQDAQA